MAVSKEWNVRPALMMEWSEDEFTLACAFIKYRNEQMKPPEV